MEEQQVLFGLLLLLFLFLNLVRYGQFKNGTVMDASRLTASYQFSIAPNGTFDGIYNVLVVAARLHHAEITMNVDGRLLISGSQDSIRATADFARRLSSIRQFFCTSPASSPTKEVRKP